MCPKIRIIIICGALFKIVVFSKSGGVFIKSGVFIRIALFNKSGVFIKIDVSIKSGVFIKSGVGVFIKSGV